MNKIVDYITALPSQNTQDKINGENKWDRDIVIFKLTFLYFLS